MALVSSPRAVKRRENSDEVKRFVIAHVERALKEGRATVPLGEILQGRLEECDVVIDLITEIVDEIPTHFSGVTATLQIGEHLVLRIPMEDVLQNVEKLTRENVAQAIAKNAELLDKVAMYGSDKMGMIILESAELAKMRDHAIGRSRAVH
ncbi:MAG: hypothetical protein Q7S47_01920 [bacterium]|nr:hypothetical protein [bacterium]